MRDRSITSTLQSSVGAAPLHAAPTVFLKLFVLTALVVALLTGVSATGAGARVVPVPQGHHIRYVRLNGTEPGEYHSGVWIMKRSTGSIRLCVVNESAADSELLACSPWAGGASSPGQYRMTDIRSYILQPTGRRVWAITGVWILNYQTGQVSACLIKDMRNPAASLRCSSFR